MTTNTIHFSTGTNGTEILRLSKDGVWVNPDIPADDVAKIVLNALDYNIKVLVQKSVEEERDACAKFVEHILKEGGGTWGDAIRARSESLIKGQA